MLIKNYYNRTVGECKVSDVIEIWGIKDLQMVTDAIRFIDDKDANVLCVSLQDGHVHGFTQNCKCRIVPCEVHVV